MANSTEEDYYGINFIPYLFTLVLAGLVIQSFIVAVNLIDWMKGRPITGADKIITSIGISRIFFHIGSSLHYFVNLSSLKFCEICSKFTISTMYTSTYSNIWLSTLLSVFFYFKISTSHNVFFLLLKTIISRRVVYLITASVMFSVGYSITYVLVTQTNVFFNSTQDNISDHIQKEMMMSPFHLLLTIFLFVMFLMASALVIIFLVIHMSRMNNCGNVRSSADAYSRTLMFTVFSMLIWALNFMTSMVVTYILFFPPFWSYYIINCFLALHSVLLIYATTKLRNQFLRIVHCGTDCFFIRKATGPRSREPVEETRL